MKQSRILPFIGPLLVLYLILDVASHGGERSSGGLLLMAAAVIASLAPVAMSGRSSPGARRVGYLGLSSGLVLVGWIRPNLSAPFLDACVGTANVAVGALLLDLALSIPDSPGGLRRFRAPVVVIGWLGGAVAIVSAFSPPGSLPYQSILDELPAWLLLGGIVSALALRLLRPRFGSNPAALASNSWALLGLLPAAVVGVATALTIDIRWIPERTWTLSAALIAAVAVGLYGHIALVDPLRRIQAGRAIRRSLTALLTAGFTVAGFLTVYPFLADDPVVHGAAVLVALVVALVLYRALYPPLRRVLAPFGGRLLDAVSSAIEELGSASNLDEAGEAVLPALRRASASPEAVPMIFLADPALCVRIDAAGQVHTTRRPTPTAIETRLRDHPGEMILRGELEDRVVRRAELRGVVEALVDLDALCVVPLVSSGEHEGLLTIPRGNRRTPLSLEELGALQHLGSHLAAFLALVSSQLRAQKRATGLVAERDRAEERLEVADEELARLRAQTKVLRAGRGFSQMPTTAVGYSVAMRRLSDRIEEIAPLEAPILMIAEIGVAVEDVAQRVHDRSSRAAAPFVVVDCTRYRPEDGEAMLFGVESDAASPGWMRLAHGGTLALKDVVALSAEAQHALAEALSTRMARSVGGAGAYNVDTRIVATTREPLEPLIERGAFSEELGRWLVKLQLALPPLRQRREDIPSLTLLAIDRACRRLGRDVMGIEPAAVEALVAHDWPGNVQELDQIIDRAVARAQGATIQRSHLPALVARDSVSPPSTAEVFEGTYEDIERRAIVSALARTEGNKSEAARQLGLKRTTLLDKIRRLGLEDETAEPPS